MTVKTSPLEQLLLRCGMHLAYLRPAEHWGESEPPAALEPGTWVPSHEGSAELSFGSGTQMSLCLSCPSEVLTQSCPVCRAGYVIPQRKEAERNEGAQFTTTQNLPPQSYSSKRGRTRAVGVWFYSLAAHRLKGGEYNPFGVAPL